MNATSCPRIKLLVNSHVQIFSGFLLFGPQTGVAGFSLKILTGPKKDPSEFELLCSLLLAALQRMLQRSDIPRPGSCQALSTAAAEATPDSMGHHVPSCRSQGGGGQQGRDKVKED